LANILEIPANSIANDAHIMNDLGGDSYQYLKFRTELERVFQVVIPDAETDRLSTVADSSRLLAELHGQVHIDEGGDDAPSRATQSLQRGWKSGKTHLGEDGSYYVDLEIGIPHMGRNNLGETPLMVLLGDMRWSHITQFTGVPSKQLVDETNDRLYATFYYVQMRFPRETPMASFGENDRLTIVNTLTSYGNSVMDGYSFLYPASWPMEKKIPLKNGKQAEELGIPYIRSSNIFVKMLKGASWLKKSRPAQPGADNIPKVAEMPDSYPRIKQASEEGNFGPPPEHFSLITPETLRLEYQIEPDRDLNGVGLIYFANYCMIQDIAERRLLPEEPLIPIGHDLLDARTVVSRQSAYLANAHQSDSIFVSIDAWLENPFLSDHPAPEMAPIRLFMNYEMIRRSDNRKMLVSSAEKVIFGKTLEEAGLLASLEKLAKERPAP
jgi:probable biosynthetic protein (TIGR04098 family)